jgi:hypothetical protein
MDETPGKKGGEERQRVRAINACHAAEEVAGTQMRSGDGAGIEAAEEGADAEEIGAEEAGDSHRRRNRLRYVDVPLFLSTANVSGNENEEVDGESEPANESSSASLTASLVESLAKSLTAS